MDTIPAFMNVRASANILMFMEQGMLRRGLWHEFDEDGREFACLLGSTGSYQAGVVCGPRLMPAWLSTITSTLFDGLSESDISTIAERYALLLRHWDCLGEAAWGFAYDGVVEAVLRWRQGTGLGHYLASDGASLRRAIGSGDGDLLSKIILDHGDDLFDVALEKARGSDLYEDEIAVQEMAQQDRAAEIRTLFDAVLDAVENIVSECSPSLMVY